ncbi:esterase [Tersicoccus solisilvae]|uniref:Esterase n=1 Tax=Tersicoccus solisilvae TaxID=1882339 RepID=A0ABQ1PAJ7_9MICC|nr:alpha/beta hydrolase [Tersicoccus solisilvae]GGC94028.1 esterase [Tersicoccus solisilvae]
MVTLPDALVPPLLRVTGANKPFVTATGARKRLQENTLRPAAYGPPKRLRGDVRVDVVQDRHWPVYTVTPTATGRPAGSLVYAHGGGWVNQIVSFHWRLIADIAAEAGVVVTVPVYPLVPWGTAGETRERVVELVRSNLDAYGPTCLAGDSAGGQIALSAALQLKDEGIRLPMTTLISPALDLTFSNPRIPDVQPTDPWLGTEGATVFAEAWRGDLPMTDPAVSPLFGDLAGLGPLTVFIGSRDVLNPDVQLLVQKARDAGVEIIVHEKAGQVHVYPLLPTRIGREAAREVVDSIARVL